MRPVWFLLLSVADTVTLPPGKGSGVASMKGMGVAVAMVGRRQAERGGAPPSRRKRGPVRTSGRGEAAAVTGGESSGGAPTKGNARRTRARGAACPSATATRAATARRRARGANTVCPRRPTRGDRGTPPAPAARARWRLATAAREDRRRRAHAAAPVRAPPEVGRQATAARPERGVRP